MSPTQQPDQGPPSPLSAHVLAADTVVGGRYRIRRQIGEGGMGAIYLAEHVELETPVALKILTTTRHTDSESVERFMREARAAVKIGHRNIVRIFDLGWLDEITPYMAMEFLRGRDLDDLLVAESWVATERCLGWLRQIASAIDVVHRQGLVHRDIKPANIFLAEEHDEIVPKLLDFGLAQLRDKDAEKRLTRDGLIVGTPHYIAPEVGLGKDPNELSDLYSFAVVAYELLCSRLPFDHGNPTTLMLEKVQHDPPPLERTQEGPVGPEVEAVFQKALNREPMFRHRSCAEFVSALERAFESRRSATDPSPPPVAGAAAAEPPSVSERPPRRANSNTDTALVRAGLEGGSGRRTAVIVALLLLALAVGLVVWAPWADGEAALAETNVPDPVDAEDDTEPEESGEPADPEPADPEPADLAPEEPAEPDVVEEAEAANTSMRRRTRRDASMDTDAVATTMGSEPTMEPAETTMASMTAPTMDAAEPTELEREEARTRARELTQQAQTALIRGRLADAARLFRQATYHDARHAPAWRGLGISHERLGQRPEARRAYERYLRLAAGASDAAAIRRRMDALAP